MLGPADCAADCRLFPVAYAGSYRLFCYDRRGRATGAADGDITGRGVSWALQRSSPSPLRGSHATASLELEGHFCRAATSLCRGPASDGAAAGKAAAALVFLDECDALASSPVVSAMMTLCLESFPSKKA